MDSTLTTESSGSPLATPGHKDYLYSDSEKRISAEVEEASKEENPDALGEQPIPDGGLQAWLVVLAAHCSAFTAFGFINAWGVFQEYYQRTLLSDKSPSTIAWIGSIQYALVFMPGLAVGVLFDRGYMRLPVSVASAGMVTATFLIAECTEYWHFLLCQGFFVGLSSGIIIISGLSVLSQWFSTKKGIAFGITGVGASSGGVVYPIAARKLIPLVGWDWTMRILGFMHLALLLIMNAFLKRRLPPKENRLPLSLSSFKNPAYLLFCAAGFTTFLGLYTVLTYISVGAVKSGISTDFAFYYVALANAGGVIGRGILGRLGDRFGPLTVIAPSTFIAGAVTYVWPFVHSKGGLVALALVYGVAGGGFLALFAAPIVHMGELHDNGSRLGNFLTCMSLGALAGPPISGAIEGATGSFVLVGVWAGTAILVSFVLFMLARHFQMRRCTGRA
ncbi:MFS general substrate transporter [Cytidiella melzeri]|nr:MFS general substrate transporter [Cytidiella melzeri]